MIRIKYYQDFDDLLLIKQEQKRTNSKDLDKINKNDNKGVWILDEVEWRVRANFGLA